MWIIGIDQKNCRVTGANHEELAVWYEKVKAEFNERLAPSLKDVNIPYDGKVIVALLFETERFPFVVKYSDEILEVPWREGTTTRSATRFELLKLLAPLQMSPNLEVLQGKIRLTRARNDTFYWTYSLSYYIEPIGLAPVVIPFHRCIASIELADINYTMEIQNLRLRPPRSGGFPNTGPSHNASATIEQGPDEIIVHNPGKINLESSKQIPEIPAKIEDNQNMTFRLSVLPVNAQQSTRNEIVLVKDSGFSAIENAEVLYQWLFLK